jgi:hypothetical protein
LGAPVRSSEGNDLFAWSLSLSADGQRIAVGAPRANANGADSGKVIIYDFVDGQWVPIGSNIPGENRLDQTGWSASLSADGQRLAVGDHYYDEPAFNAGRMRVFQWVEGDWVQIGEEVIGEQRADFYGQKVAISPDGSTVAVAGPQGGDGVDTPGQIKVFGNYPWVAIARTREPAKQLRIFPNPVQDYLFVEAPPGSSWQVFDALGQPLRHGEIGEGPIDLRTLPPGSYTLRLQFDRTYVTGKIIKH